MSPPASKRLIAAVTVTVAVALGLLAVGAVRLRPGRPNGAGHAQAAQEGPDEGAAAGRADVGPAAACGPGLKRCDGRCVSIDRPDYGCGGESCRSCRIANATARCNPQHECDTGACYQAFADCDGDGHNGCETDLRVDPDHCGACDRRCPLLPHAERGCGDTCTVWRCEPGFGDCNGASEDGCEVSTRTDPENCGRCGFSCGPGQRCRDGGCAR